MAAALTLKKEFINEWKTTHLGENNMQSSIVKLREVQSQLEVNTFLYTFCIVNFGEVIDKNATAKLYYIILVSSTRSFSIRFDLILFKIKCAGTVVKC